MKRIKDTIVNEKMIILATVVKQLMGVENEEGENELYEWQLWIRFSDGHEEMIQLKSKKEGEGYLDELSEGGFTLKDVKDMCYTNKIK